MRNLLSIALVAVCTTSCVGFLSFFKTSDSGMYKTYSGFPRRSPFAISGSKFIASTGSFTAAQREAAIFKELKQGNIPNFLRNPQPVKVSYRHGREILVATLKVMPDYLAIGSDSDFVRIPMTPMVAQRIADQFGYCLPTRKLVDDIYQQASIKLSPKTLPAGSQMATNRFYKRHQQSIEQQLRGRRRGALVAGHKKDIVLTNRLINLPTRVAIYGWHLKNGVPIQPLSTVHGAQYADYSHGVRFIQNVVQVGRYKMLLQEIMKHHKYSGLVSDEGAIVNPRLRTEHPAMALASLGTR